MEQPQPPTCGRLSKSCCNTTNESRSRRRTTMQIVNKILKPAGTWMWSNKFRLFIVALALIATAPRAVQAQLVDPCCALLSAGLTTINSTIKSVVGGGLNKILGVDQQIQQFEQSVIFPIQQIQQAIGLVT